LGIIEKAQKGAEKGILKAQKGVEKVVIQPLYYKFGEVRKSYPLLVALIILIIGAIVLWVIGTAIVGFFKTPLGITCLICLFASIGIYGYLRYLGIKLSGWLGALIEIALIFLAIIIFFGASSLLMSFFMMVTPIIIIGAIIYFFYKLVKGIEDPTIKAFAMAMGIIFVIFIFIANTFLVPYTVGNQVIIQIDLTRTEEAGVETVDITPRMYEPSLTWTVSTTMNPYIVTVGELSRRMWKFGDVKGYIVDWKLYDQKNYNRLVAESYNNKIYIEKGETESLYSVVYLKYRTQQAFDYRLEIYVYDMQRHLITSYSYHYYGTWS